MLEWLTKSEKTEKKEREYIVCSATTITVAEATTRIMESSELRRRRIKQNRRKERAEKVEKERTTSNDPDDDNVGPPVKKPRKKPRKPMAEEDIVDGFAILAFKNYEDLTRAVKLAEEDSDHKKICVQVLKRSQDGSDNKGIDKDKKIKKPKTNSDLSNQPFKENGDIMVDKVPGIDIRSSAPSTGSPYPHPKKLVGINGPSSKDPLHALICESDDNSDKISDGCSDLFAPSRKDSSPQIPDNLHSSNDHKGVDIQRHQVNCEKNSSSLPSTAVTPAAADVKAQQSRQQPPSDSNVIKPLQKNGPVKTDLGKEELNGHLPTLGGEPATAGVISSQPPVPDNKFLYQATTQKASIVKSTTVPQTTLFTPYAATAITRVNTQVLPGSSQCSSRESPHDSSHTAQSNSSKPLQNTSSQPPRVKHINSNQHHNSSSVSASPVNASPGSLNSVNNIREGRSSLPSGLHHHPYRHSPTPTTEKIPTNKPPRSCSPQSSHLNRKFHSSTPTPTTTQINNNNNKPSTTSNKSAAFGSIARLLDSPTSTRSSSPVGPVAGTNATVTTSTNFHIATNQAFATNNTAVTNGNSSNNLNGGGGSGGVSVPNTCSSRSHSPRGHSPSRERDSYSSNVSSLSRTSITPVSGSSQLPPTISPLQNLQSYSKAASWLNSNVPGLSPAPRQTPPQHPNQSLGPSSSSAPAVVTSNGGSGAGVGGGGGGSGGAGGVNSLQISSGAPPLSITGGGRLSISAGNTPSPHSVFPGLVPGAPHSLPPPNSSAMFAPPILPLSTIAPHPGAHPSPFVPSADAIFHGTSTSSELVRRDLESRFLSSERSMSAAQSPFMTRPGDMHPHSHQLLPPLPGVNHLPPQSPGSSNQPPPHSALFPPPLFKDMPKVGLDSPFFRTNLALPYPGFNGLLHPNMASTPFAAPSQIAAFTPKITDACKPPKVMKSGRWNAMHVRIAWEIYQDQQKNSGGGDKNSSNSAATPAKDRTSLPSSNSTTSGAHPPPPPSSSSLAAELLRQPPQHTFSGLSRPPEVGPGPPPPFSPASLLSSHHPGPAPSHRPQFEPPHSMFLNSSHLGPHVPRYPGYGGLGPTYGGLSGLGSSLLSRDLSSLTHLGPSQEQWHRIHRGAQFPPVSQLPAGWPLPQRAERDVKTPIESRRLKEERLEKRQESSSSSHQNDSGKGSRDMSPFRDRSPLRLARTPLENGDTDSRSSRSSDSHSTVHLSSSKSSSSRLKEESNGDLDRTSTPLLGYDREKLLHHQHQSDNKHQSLASVSHASRLYASGSPAMTTPTSMWDSFPGLMGNGPRMAMAGAEQFRLSFLPLNEREREFARLQHPSLRPPLFSNGPFPSIPSLGMGSPVLHPPGANGNTLTKGGPSGGGPIPMSNPSMSAAAAAAAAAHNHFLHASLNGPNQSPKPEELNSASGRTKEDSQSR